MKLSRISVRTALIGLSLFAATIESRANAAAIIGWAWDTVNGNSDTLSNLNTDSPVLGDGSDQSARNKGIYASFSEISLNDGDEITFSGSFVVTGNAPISISAGGLRMGLFNDITTTDENPDSNPATGWVGYLMRSVPAAGGQLRGRVTATPAGESALTTAGAGQASFGDAPPASASSFSSGTIYNFALTAERDGEEVLVSASLTGSDYSVSYLPQQVTGTVLKTFSFDRVALLSSGSWSSGNPDLIEFSNLDVTYIPIPEPNAFVLSIVGMIGWAGFRKRMRK